MKNFKVLSQEGLSELTKAWNGTTDTGYYTYTTANGTMLWFNFSTPQPAKPSLRSKLEALKDKITD